MLLSCDKTRFPVLTWPERGLSLQLLPIAKVQFEVYLGEANCGPDSWYDEVLQASPRVSWRRFTGQNRERLFLTAIRPDEIEPFGFWLGPGWRIPSVCEWRQAASWLASVPLTQLFLDEVIQAKLHPAATAILRGILTQTQPKNLLEFCLFRGGVVEWVHDRQAYAGLGEPRGEFASVLCQPQQVEPLRPLDPLQRLPYFGARLVWTPPLAAETSTASSPLLLP